MLLCGGLLACVVCVLHFLSEPRAVAFSEAADYLYMTILLLGVFLIIFGGVVFSKRFIVKKEKKAFRSECPVCGAKTASKSKKSCEYCGERFRC